MAECNINELLADACTNKFSCVDESTQRALLLQLLCNVSAGGGGGGAVWGDITGTLSNQTDLQTALNAKLNLSGGTMTGLLTIAQATANTSAFAVSGYSLTGSNATAMLSLEGTWNTSGTPTAIYLNITDTASNAASSLMDLRRNGISWFKVEKDGNLGFAGTFILKIGGANIYQFSTNARLDLLNANGYLAINSDVRLTRDAANTLAQRNDANAQSFRWYRTFTDASNYERGALQTAAGQVIVAAETAGTGTDDIDVTLTPAGAGNVRFGTHSALAVETIDGYITIKDAGGTLRKLAVIS